MFKAIRRIVARIRRPKSVDGIISDLSQKARQLRTLSDSLRAQAERDYARADDIANAAAAKCNEASRAVVVAAKFEALTS